MSISGFVILCVLSLGALTEVVVSQIPTACTDRRSLEDMTCCPASTAGVCGEDRGRGLCVAVNFTRHSNQTTDVRVNWPHYYTRICKCSGNYGGYDCSQCKYGYYGENCGTRAILPRKPLRDFTDEEWVDFVNIMRMTKTVDSGYKVVLEERVPGTAELVMSNISLYNLMIWIHHYSAKNAFDFFGPAFLDYAHFGPAFFTWHRWFHIFFEYEIQAMLQTMGRVDYHKFRLPYWDWRGEIQRSYGLPSEQLFTFNRFGETRNVSNRPIVFGDLLRDGWNTVCMDTPEEICDPSIITFFLQRCPFTGDPNLCHSSNPDWPTMQEVNELLNINNYAKPPFNIFSVDSFRGVADFKLLETIEACREDLYCACIPGGPECDVPNNATSVTKLTGGVHTKGHAIPGQGGLAFLPPEIRGSMFDVAGSPNDPFFIPYHLMLDCIFQEWTKRHPNSGYPDDPLIRDGHRKDDYMRTYFPLITNEEVFGKSTEDFGYYCKLPNLDVTAPFAPSPLETTFSFIISDSGNSVDVCVETKEAAALKLVLRDSNKRRHVRKLTGVSGCSTFQGLPAGRHHVRAISRERLPGHGGKRYKSDFMYFSTK